MLYLKSIWGENIYNVETLKYQDFFCFFPPLDHIKIKQIVSKEKIN